MNRLLSKILMLIFKRIDKITGEDFLGNHLGFKADDLVLCLGMFIFFIDKKTNQKNLDHFNSFGHHSLSLWAQANASVKQKMIGPPAFSMKIDAKHQFLPDHNFDCQHIYLSNRIYKENKILWME